MCPHQHPAEANKKADAIINYTKEVNILHNYYITNNNTNIYNNNTYNTKYQYAVGTNKEI
jgi:hypothetical protein